MKLTNLSTALFLLSTTACGAVVEPTEDASPTAEGLVEEPAASGDTDAPRPAAPPPLLIEEPRAAATPRSLFAMTFAAGSPIENLITPEPTTHYDVVEQKIVTISDQEVQLVVELAPPTGSYTRTLVTDALRNGGTYADYVLCESNNVWQFDPRCESAAPVVRELPSTGPLTASRWKVSVVDDVSGTPLASCVPSGAHRVSCVLPARAAASYRILASAAGFTELWDGSAGFGAFVMGGDGFIGAHASQTEWQCWSFQPTATALYCGARYQFVRFTAIDRARLEFDPISLRITANGGTATMASPALIWDAGNDDVPGMTY